MQCHVIILGTIGTIYIFYEREREEKSKEKRKAVLPSRSGRGRYSTNEPKKQYHYIQSRTKNQRE